MIPYELIKIYRDKGIDLSRFYPDFHIYYNIIEFHEDKFIYNAF